MPLQLTRLIDDPKLLLGCIEIGGGQVAESSPALKVRAEEITARLLSPGFVIPEEKRSAVRQALKAGGFSPTGRNRPAHEFLINDISERQCFNYISNVVDANNVFSLECLLPISIFDAGKLGGALTIRIGEEGEGYVFNPAGHRLDVKRCVVCCRGSAPGEACGTPVKDSMETKVFEGAEGFLGVIYGASVLYPAAEFAALTQAFAELLAAETGGEIVQVKVL